LGEQLAPSREDILDLVRKYYEEVKTKLPPNKVPASGKVFDSDELVNAVCAVLDCWWTEGEFNSKFERKLSAYVGTRFALTVNSGSSANLVAFYTLTSRKLGDKRIKQGDEVITVAAAFPTTVNPIIQFGAVPVFVDVESGTYNVNADLIEDAITEKTKAVFLAHTLGNPFDLAKVKKSRMNTTSG